MSTLAPAGAVPVRVQGSVQRAVRTYLDHLVVERGVSAHTLAAYRRDLDRYASWLAAA
jgi:integrase/recombinase XerD